MSKTLKELRTQLQEATASTTNLQYLRAKTANNAHFETRRYIASEILKDKQLADAYKSLEFLHTKHGNVVMSDAITIRQRLEKKLKEMLKAKISNWDEVYSAI
jgi:hypothetical protein